MRKNLHQSIVKSLGRYIAIVAIIALGASIFVGLRMTKADMVATGQKYMDQQNMFDLRLVSSYGWSRDQLDDIEKIASESGLVDVEGVFYIDLIGCQGDVEENVVYRFYTIPETVNQLVLRGGRMPEAPNECLADGFRNDDSILGTEVMLSEDNEESSLDCMASKTFTVVGYISTPLYMDMNRGTTSVGSGSIANYFFVPQETIDANYFTEIHVTVPGEYAIYSEEYNDTMDAIAEELEPKLELLAEERFQTVLKEAKEAYADGVKEYEEGLQEFEEGKKEAEEELQDAYQKLLDGEQELKENEQKLIDGEEQIADAWVTLAENEKTLEESRQMLAASKSEAYLQMSAATATLMENYKSINENMQLVNNGILQIEAGLIELNSGITQLESGLSQMDSGINQLQIMINLLDTTIRTTQSTIDFMVNFGFGTENTLAQLQKKLEEMQVTREEYNTQLTQLNSQRQEYGAQLDALYAQRTELESQLAELEGNKQQLNAGLAAVQVGFQELEAGQLQMEQQFAAAQAQLEAGSAQIAAYRKELEIREKEIADGWSALEEGRLKLEDGWIEYEEGKAEAEQEIADAEAELAEAAQKLADAKETIDGMKENSFYILDRNTNVGYANLDSSSDIVAGISKVFPVFFLLVAALVCITTMTRMVDEERTQIGTLKALGYSNGAIISKYLIYAGSSAIVGCGLGVLLGSVVFPTILWEVYKIMLYITPGVVLTFDWKLCLAVVAAYSAVMLLVTWYCCYRTLEEVPAELIRPKAPAAGKQMMFEKMPFWHRISFLNKVTIRNIFRYRQRLMMMLLGIGGCTALLLTGFGLRDSIVNIVNFQFEEITTYDMEVYFSEGQSDDSVADFRAEIEDCAEDVMFYHQTSVEIDFDNQVSEIYMIAAGEDITRFIDFHSGDVALELPGQDEILLSVGVAEILGIKVGDQVMLRDSDMNRMVVNVSGIYDNHVYNYAIVSPKTIEMQWGESPEFQMALVKVLDGKDPHKVSAQISSMENVMNVSVSADLAGMVSNMMEALNLVVVVVVVCAGLLAAIVLYNLTNININERIREIATIKVLGFNAKETAMYIFKENLTLSVFGTFLGLFLGKLLLAFVMSEIKINMVWFMARALPMSYVLSVVMTILMAILVDFVFYFKLEKINMAEALKSVE